MAALDAGRVPFLCINVESSTERLAWQREQCAGLDLRVVPVAAVVPGSAAFETARGTFGALWMQGENEWRGPAANAIVLSWVAAFRAASKRPEPWVLVGEDDAVFAADARPRLDALREALPRGACGVFLHALGVPKALAPHSEHSEMTFAAPPGGWGRGRVFSAWPTYATAPDQRVMSGDPAVCLVTPAGADRVAEEMERELRTACWNPFDQIVPYLPIAASKKPRLLLAGDPGLVWELGRANPDQAGAASNREANDARAGLDAKASFHANLTGPTVKPTKRKFKVGIKKKVSP